MPQQQAFTTEQFVSHLADDLNAGDLELPIFPQSAVRLQRVLSSDDYAIDDVVGIVSSDAALASRVLHLSNSASLRGRSEIVDIRQAIMRMGNRLLQSSVVAYALRQVSRHETLTPHARSELNAIYTESIELAALSRVIAQKFTRLNADEATLTGLLSSIGRLYIFVKFSEVAEASDSAGVKEVIDSWHPAIAKAIGETWQLPDELLHALESQMSTDPELQEKPTLTEVLCAARLFSAHVADGLTIPSRTYPLLRRLGIEHDESPAATLAPFQEELSSFRSGLSG